MQEFDRNRSFNHQRCKSHPPSRFLLNDARETQHQNYEWRFGAATIQELRLQVFVCRYKVQMLVCSRKRVLRKDNFTFAAKKKNWKQFCSGKNKLCGDKTQCLPAFFCRYRCLQTPSRHEALTLDGIFAGTNDCKRGAYMRLSR